MKKVLVLVVILSVVGIAQGQVLSLYEQEGTGADGPSAIDVSGEGPATNPSSTNWKYQYGSGWWSGIYGDSGWDEEEDGDGDMILDIEADIELYMYETISNNKIYFHLGNVIDATDADKTAYVDGTLSYNNGMWLGISFDGTNKDLSNMEQDGGVFTGKIIDAMQSDNDAWRVQDNQMDIEIMLSWGDGWRVPDSYGDGAHSTIHDTLWWLVDDGNPGFYNYQCRVKILPEGYHPDGDYYLDPAIVAVPVL